MTRIVWLSVDQNDVQFVPIAEIGGVGKELAECVEFDIDKQPKGRSVWCNQAKMRVGSLNLPWRLLELECLPRKLSEEAAAS